MKKVRFLFSGLAAALAVAAVFTFNSGVTARPNVDALFQQTGSGMSQDCTSYNDCTVTFTQNGFCTVTTYTTDGGTSCSGAVTSYKINP